MDTRPNPAWLRITLCTYLNDIETAFIVVHSYRVNKSINTTLTRKTCTVLLNTGYVIVKYYLLYIKYIIYKYYSSNFRDRHTYVVTLYSRNNNNHSYYPCSFPPSSSMRTHRCLYIDCIVSIDTLRCALYESVVYFNTIHVVTYYTYIIYRYILNYDIGSCRSRISMTALTFI